MWGLCRGTEGCVYADGNSCRVQGLRQYLSGDIWKEEKLGQSGWWPVEIHRVVGPRTCVGMTKDAGTSCACPCVPGIS